MTELRGRIEGGAPRRMCAGLSWVQARDVAAYACRASRCLLRAVCLLKPGKCSPVWVGQRTRFESRASMFPPPAHVGALISNRVRSHARHWTGKWGHRWDSRPALLDTNETPRFLGFGGMVQAEGIAVSTRPRARSRGTSVVQPGTAFIVRRDCCCSPCRPRRGHPHDSPLA